MLKPVITRFRLINDALESSGGRTLAREHPAMLPGSQAYSADFMRMWAWRPFSPSEKYKATREIEISEIPATKAGFTREEVEYIILKIKERGKEKNLSMDDQLMLEGKVQALPIDGGRNGEYSIDKVVRKYTNSNNGPSIIEKEYGIKIDVSDIFEARSKLSNHFTKRASESAETSTDYTASGKGVMPGASWVFSPYFVFLDVPLLRVMLRLPNGAEIENLMIENLRTATRTQNVIILNYLEVIAREKQMENYIGTMLGEVEGKNFLTIEELSKEQYPEIFGKLEKLKVQKEKGLSLAMKQIKSGFGDVLRSFGFKSEFVDWVRARGPYEFALDDRITEVIQPEPGHLFGDIVRYLQQIAGVPGVKW